MNENKLNIKAGKKLHTLCTNIINCMRNITLNTKVIAGNALSSIGNSLYIVTTNSFYHEMTNEYNE